MINKIQSLIRRGTILGVMVTAFASSSLIHPKALALPTEQISQKLNSVRGFTLRNQKGNFFAGSKDKNSQRPVFIGRIGNGSSYITTTENSRRVVPIFFEKKQLDNIIAKLRTSNPELAAIVKIEVIGTLEEFIAYLHSNDFALDNISLVPSSEVLALLRQQQRARTKKPAKKKYQISPSNIYQMQRSFGNTFLR